LTNSYFYADGQLLLGRKFDGVDGNDVPIIDSNSFYIHDRLGSTRLVVDSDGDIENSYTYTPFGEDLEKTVGTANWFKFTGQWYDIEISQYYLRARMYDPQLMRFTTRDPIRGNPREPMALHRYLYCQNEPLNRIDPSGRLWGALARAAHVVNAANVRNVAHAGVLGSSIGSFEQIIVLGIINTQVAAYVDPQTETRDYRSGPEAFRHLGVTQEEINKYGSDIAVLVATERIAIEGALQAGLHQVTALVGGTIGATLNLTGVCLIKGGKAAIGGGIFLVGALIDVYGAYEAGQAIQIDNNADEAVKLYCDPKNPVR